MNENRTLKIGERSPLYVLVYSKYRFTENTIFENNSLLVEKIDVSSDSIKLKFF